MVKEKSINVRGQEFKSALYDLVNSSQLPISMVYYIFQYVFKDLENTYYGVLNSETISEEHSETGSQGVNEEEMPDEITSKEGLEDETNS